MTSLVPISRKEKFACFGALVAWSLLVFRQVIPFSSTLLTTDDNLGALAMRKATLPQSFFGGWDDSILVGLPMNLSINFTNILMWLLPTKFFVDWIHAIDLMLASFFLYLFLRRRGLGILPICFGMITAFYVGSNFTLTFAGHIGKFGVLVFATLFLYLAQEAIHRRSPWWGMLAGGAIGGMFLEQADVAMFFSFFLFPYALFELWTLHGKNVKAWMPVLAPLMVIAVLCGLRPLLSGYTDNVADASAVQEDSKAKWEFITQWSWPPQESADFILPGLMGWRSGEPTGPYRGVMGRSAGWKESGQGFRNFKLESQYIGFIPIAISLWIGLFAFRNNRWIRFWIIASAVSLILSFGKFTPFYHLFYALPIVSEVRNPNKFLQVWQLITGILAAAGVQHLLYHDDVRKRIKPLTLGVTVMFGILLLWYFVSAMGLNNQIKSFTEAGWGGSADTLANLRLRAIGIGAAMAGILAGVLWMLHKEKLQGRAMIIAFTLLLIIVGADTLSLHKKYIATMDPALTEENQVVTVLKTKFPQRTYLLDQAGFYNTWLTYLFPYHGIDTFNFTQYPRMPDDYRTFLQSFSRNPFALWQYSAVGYLLGPAQAWGQLQANPNIKDHFTLEFAHRVKPTASQMAVEVLPSTEQQRGTHCIIRFNRPAPRYSLISNWEFAELDEQIQRMASGGVEPLETVLLEPSAKDIIGEPTGGPRQDTIQIASYSSSKVVLKVSSDRTALLRSSDKYAPGLEATVNGESADVLRCDYLFRAIKIPPGLHEVVITYKAPLSPLFIQLAGMAGCIFALGMCIFRKCSHC